MKRYIAIYAVAAFFSISMIVFGCIFADSKIGEVVFTEETISGNRSAAEGLEAGMRADSSDELHWISSYDFSTGKTESVFRRGEMTAEAEAFLYDDIRFNGSTTIPYGTELEFEELADIQGKKLHGFFDELQHDSVESGEIQTGKIKLDDYLDYYPVSFRFQLGTKILNSDNALTGLKIYDEQNKLSPENAAVYDEEIQLYKAFNDMFKIPVIDDEYLEFEIEAQKTNKNGKSLPYRTVIKRSAEEGEDYYYFDPVIALQEENILDGKTWYHPDLEESEDESRDGKNGKTGGDASDAEGDSAAASEYNMKNRILFIVNNRTAKGRPADVSQLREGFGIYELPIDVNAAATVRKGKRSWTLPNPVPLADEMEMIYPLDSDAEYAEISLSPDHRYLAVFSVKDGFWNAEIIDADRRTEILSAVMFPESSKLVYAWGEDGSLSMTSHDGYIAVFENKGTESEPYRILYEGKVSGDFGKAFFDTDIKVKKDCYSSHVCAEDKGLAVSIRNGKAALVQNLLAADEGDVRNAALECAVIDESGVAYRGVLKSSIVDMNYDMSPKEIELIIGEDNISAKKQTILPLRSENRVKWTG